MQVVVSQKSGKVLCVHAATGSCHDFQLFKQSRLPLARALKVLTDSGGGVLKCMLPQTNP